MAEKTRVKAPSETQQKYIDFISRYSLAHNDVLSKVFGRNKDAVRSHTSKLTKNNLLQHQQLFTDDPKVQFWCLTEKGKEYSPTDLAPALFKASKKGGDSFNQRERYAKLMFCCGGENQRTLLSRKEMSDFIGRKASEPPFDSMYIDRTFHAKVGQAMLGNIYVSQPTKYSLTMEKVSEKISDRINTLLALPVIQELISNRLFTLAYLCESKLRAQQIEQHLAGNPINTRGCWLSIYPIENIQRVAG